MRFIPETIIFPEVIQSEGEQHQRRLTSVPETSETPDTCSKTPRIDEAPQPDNLKPSRRLSDGIDPPEPGTGRGFRTRKAPGDYAKLHRGESVNYAEGKDSETHLTIPMDEFALALGDQGDPKSVREALAGPEKGCDLDKGWSEQRG